MSNEVIALDTDTNLQNLANQLIELDKKIILIFAFNSTGKTRLSVEYKNITKQNNNGSHSGVYYNAYSEDLFVWNNDTENGEQNIRLTIMPSSLNQYHNLLGGEEAVREKLTPYKPKYNFYFNMNEDSEKGIDSISFYLDGEEETPIKISRGEERIFVWCFFLALFEVEGLADQQNKHFFIDDPVSSLDDHNIFITAATLFDLIERHYENRKFVVTTHHLGMATILNDWLTKGEKAEKFKKVTKQYILERNGDNYELANPKKSVLLYHLFLLQILEEADSKDELYNYHFALLRQVLENIASFLGVGQFSYVLKQIGIVDMERIATIVNDLSHKKVYYYQSALMVQDNKDTFREILNGLKNKYKFILHED